MVAHDFAGSGQKAQHVGQQVDVALLHGALLGGGGGAAGHAVFDHVVVHALEPGRCVAVVIGHDLLEGEVGGADHVLVQVGVQADLVLDEGGGGQDLALSVPAHAGADGRVHDVGAGFGGRAHGRHEQAVRVVAVVVQDQLGVSLPQGGGQGLDEARGADPGHVLEAQDDALDGLAFGDAGRVGAEAQDFFGDFQVVVHGEAFGP